jgi:hypothetical protein
VWLDEALRELEEHAAGFLVDRLGVEGRQLTPLVEPVLAVR